ncbi:hypothetical protein SAMN05216176_10350 [Nitratireductor indicus]|nr:hypothetical protein SAMN05216176_10350 [Nitratireductor indicus]
MNVSVSAICWLACPKLRKRHKIGRSPLGSPGLQNHRAFCRN